MLHTRLYLNRKRDMRVEKCNVQKHVMHNQYYQLKTFHDAVNEIRNANQFLSIWVF